MNNSNINEKMCEVNTEALLSSDLKSPEDSDSLLGCSVNDCVCTQSNSTNARTIKSIIQRCQGMFIKNEAIQEKKKKLADFVNPTLQQ